MKTKHKRALGVIVSAAVALLFMALNLYAKVPAELQAAMYSLITAVAAYWQIELPTGQKAEHVSQAEEARND